MGEGQNMTIDDNYKGGGGGLKVYDSMTIGFKSTNLVSKQIGRCSLPVLLQNKHIIPSKTKLDNS